MIFVISSVAIAIVGVWGVNKFNSRELANNELLMENVEALTQDEIVTAYECSRPLKYYTCYDSRHMFCGMAIMEVERYKATVPYDCTHVSIQACNDVCKK